MPRKKSETQVQARSHFDSCKGGTVHSAETGVDCVRLLPRQPVFLQPLNVCDEDYLVDVFCQTWKSIPLAARRKILRHIRKQPGGLLVKSHRLQGGLRGAAYYPGDLIVVCSEIVDLWPKTTLEDTIAHELAHILDYAGHFQEQYEDFIEAVEAIEDPGEYQTTEDRVEAIAKGWGFERGYIAPTKSDHARITRNLPKHKEREKRLEEMRRKYRRMRAAQRATNA